MGEGEGRGGEGGRGEGRGREKRRGRRGGGLRIFFFPQASEKNIYGEKLSINEEEMEENLNSSTT